jgi:hypothetical protein
MSENPESIAIFNKKIGKYDWVVGEDGNKTIDVLNSLITQDALTALVKFNKEALGLNSIYKPEMVSGEVVTTTSETKEGFWNNLFK